MADNREIKKLLAGPILRRVEPDSVSVWLAFGQTPGVLHLVITGGPAPVIAVPARVLRLGERLYVVLMRWRRGKDAALAPGKVYQYELFDGNTPLLAELKLGVGGYPLPSFVLPSSIASGLRVAQASCRKPHGGGFDALALLAGALDETASSPSTRPQQLYLTGDQIYADDVAPELLKHLSSWSADLFGWTETLADEADLPEADRTKLKPHLTPRAAMAANPPKDDRSKFLYVTRFKPESWQTSELDYYRHHLLGFQEWCTMYLLAWSEVLWKDFAPKRGKEADPVLQNLDAFGATVGVVRRALANIATYMIFDDHDVTDDWFMAAQRAVVLSEDGRIPRNIIRNALLAYAVFQDWGNQPDEYAVPGALPDMLLTAVDYKVEGRTGPPAFQNMWKDSIAGPLGISAATASDSTGKRKSWHYQYVGPDFDTIVLDSRTWRGKCGGKDGLSGGGGMRSQLDVLTKNFAKGKSRRCILVSPAPLAGFLMVELGQRGKMVFRHAIKPVLTEASDVALDWEGWHTNAPALDSLIKTLKDAGVRPVVLSGDVHYAYSELARRPPPKDSKDPKAPWEFLQLCSSSAKNSEMLTRALGLTDLLTVSPLNPANLSSPNNVKISAAELTTIAAALGMNVEGMFTAVLNRNIEMFNKLTGKVQDALADPKQAATDFGVFIRDKFWDANVVAANLGDAALIIAKELAYLLACIVSPGVMTLYTKYFGYHRIPRGLGPGASGVFEPSLITDPLVDKRGSARFAANSEVLTWYKLYGKDIPLKASVSAAAQVEVGVGGNAVGVGVGGSVDLSLVRDRSVFLDWYNFLSVGDSNISLVALRAVGDKTSVSHELRWTTAERATDMPLFSAGLPGLDNKGVPPWAATLHEIVF